MARVGHLRKLVKKPFLLGLELPLPVLMLHSLDHKVFGARLWLVTLPARADFLEPAAIALDLDQRTVLFQVAQQPTVAHALLATFQRALEGAEPMAVAGAHMLDVVFVRVHFESFHIACRLVHGRLRIYFKLVFRVLVLQFAHLLQNGLVFGRSFECFERRLILISATPLNDTYFQLRAISMILVTAVGRDFSFIFIHAAVAETELSEATR